MRMRSGLVTLLLALSLLSAGSVRADVEGDLPKSPGAALGAAAINVVYIPVRLALSTVWAGVSCITGYLTGGDEYAAEDVWNLTRGPGYITPGMLTGREHFRFGNWESGH